MKKIIFVCFSSICFLDFASACRCSSISSNELMKNPSDYQVAFQATYREQKKSDPQKFSVVPEDDNGLISKGDYFVVIKAWKKVPEKNIQIAFENARCGRVDLIDGKEYIVIAKKMEKRFIAKPCNMIIQRTENSQEIINILNRWKK